MLPSKEERFVDFTNFYGTFLEKNKGWSPSNWRQWWDSVESSKDQIRSLIGGEIIQQNVSLEGQQGDLGEDAIAEFAKRIDQTTPGYFEAYQYSPYVLKQPMIPGGSHNAIKLTKHYNNYATRYIADRYIDEEKRSKTNEVQKLLSDLGDAWKKSKTSKVDLEITLSTRPKGFALLGHYGPDQDSCWRQHTTNEQSKYDKYCFGQTKNTFVISISKFYEKKNKQKNIARCIGFLSDDQNTLALANYYYSPGFSEGDGLGAIQSLIESIWGKKANFAEGIVAISGRAEGWKFSHNPYGNWAFYKEGSSVSSQKLIINANKIVCFSCQRCDSNRRMDEEWRMVDGQEVCCGCYQEASICEITRNRTFSPVEVFDNKGGTIIVHPDIAKNAEHCQICGCKTMITYANRDGQRMCTNCLEALYSQCDICGELTQDPDIVGIDDQEICKQCIVENGIMEQMTAEEVIA